MLSFVSQKKKKRYTLTIDNKHFAPAINIIVKFHQKIKSYQTFFVFDENPNNVSESSYH